MVITIRKAVAEAVGKSALEKFGVSEYGWAHQDNRQLDLSALSAKALNELEQLLTKHAEVRGAKGNLRDLQAWKKALTEPGQKARGAQHLYSLLKLFLKPLEGQRVYENDHGHWWACYVDSLAYESEHKDRDRIPAQVQVKLVYEELGGRHVEKRTIYEDEAVGKTPLAALAFLGLHPETKELREEYLAAREKFVTLQPQIGLQLKTVGIGTDNLDGNPQRDSSWYWSRTQHYALGTPENPGRAVVDVFREEKGEDRESRVYISDFWGRKRSDDDDDDPEERSVPEIPIHPTMAVFDLKLHLRLRVHVADVEPYKYDTALADKLILRPELKALVKLLVEYKEGAFQDIVKGKSGGAVILLAGPPGTGKTLTAEVYAEAEQRALYSVQCSQLGVDPEQLEEELLKIFSRAKRWNAVLLLDEADVYVHSRGNDLNQNAIVGVFLRVLEYQSAVLFLTTNRPDDVDDAIASRCIARLVYQVPDPKDQKSIWAVLVEASGANLSEQEADRIVARSPGLSGRDVKNLLKLAMLQAKGQPITAEMVDFVKQFKPTGPMRLPMLREEHK